MNDLHRFIVESHQFFFGLLALSFCFSVVLDLNKIKTGIGVNKRIIYTSIIGIIGVGLCFNFYESWQGEGGWFAVQFGLLCAMSLVAPKYAASFFLFILLTRPWETFENDLMQTMPKDIFYLCVLSLAAHKLAKNQLYLRFNWGTVFLLAFAMWCFFSGFISSHQIEAMVKFKDIFLKGVILFLLLQNCFERKEDLLPAKLSLVFAILDLGTISFYSTYINSQQTLLSEGVQRLETVGILGNSNDIAAILVLSLPFCFFLFQSLKPRILSTIASLGLCAPIIYLIWNAQSRGALLALFIGVGGYFFTKVKSKKAILFALLLSVGMAFGSFSLLNRNQQDLEGSSSNRMIYWKAGLNMGIRNPVFGVGFWGFNRNLPSYAIGGNLGSEGEHMTAHSSWVQVISENGIVGFSFYLGLWLFAIKRSWTQRFKNPEYFVALVGYGVASSFLSHAYLLYPYILTALSIGFSYLQEGKSIEQTEAELTGELAWNR